LVITAYATTLTLDYYADPQKRGYLSSPVVDLSELGLAPSKEKPKPALPMMSLRDLVARAHATSISAKQENRLRVEFQKVRTKYEEAVTLAKKEGYVDGKTRIPKLVKLRPEEIEYLEATKPVGNSQAGAPVEIAAGAA
jgi:hypothetical protein